MIRDAEIRRIARAAGVEPRIVELDHALGWALRGIAGHEALCRRLVFKGGTCLRKCYFADYRFSEDLDFTATERFGWEEFAKVAGEAFAKLEEASGIDFAVREPKLKLIDDEYGRETLKLTIYWRGSHSLRGSPRGLRLDITRNEVVLFEPVRRAVAHDFSDSEELGAVQLRCYTLEEVMMEKIRALLGQRIYAMSRDLYDISTIRKHVDEAKVARGLSAKLSVKGLSAEAMVPHRLTERRDEFEADWERNLAQLLPPGVETEFDDVWRSVIEYVSLTTEGLRTRPRSDA